MSNVVGMNGKVIETEPVRTELSPIQEEMLKTIEDVDQYCMNRGLLGGLDWGNETLNKAFEGLNPGLIMVAGQANVGKSAFCMQVGWEIAQANRIKSPPRKPFKAYVLYFSLDDNATELLPRIVAIDQGIPINVVKAPRKYEDDIEYMTLRAKGIQRLKDSLDCFRLLDSTMGSSVEFIEKEIKRHKMELESIDTDYRIVAIIDNFHDITVESINFRDNGNAKFDYIAGELSRLCTQYDMPIICTAEFRKLNGNRRPIVDDVRESVKIAYEAKAIMLCYNEVGLRGEAASIYYQRPELEFAQSKQPILEVKIGKNKYTSNKTRLFFEFAPEMSLLKEVSPENAMRYNQMIIG